MSAKLTTFITGGARLPNSSCSLIISAAKEAGKCVTIKLTNERVVKRKVS